MPTYLERLQEAVGLRYRIDLETEVGTGGRATVSRPPASQLDCPVAIKALRPELVTATAAERFLREAQILANLPHPNIVPIRDYGSRNGIDFYIMQWLGAETLAQRLARGRLSLHEAQHLAEGLLAALAVAHRHGVIHRDVKPSNIFLVDGRAGLTDFGVAQSLTGEKLTDPRAMIGTQEYMSPEQMAGVTATPRSDVYSAGIVLYEALTGLEWRGRGRPPPAGCAEAPP